ncbi:MAG: hypothetical protein ACRD88_14685 [Terriglobia bacterium]
MANRGSVYGRWIAMGILVPLCVWLVYRNLLGPGDPRVSASVPQAGSAVAATQARPAPDPSPAAARRGRPDESLSQEQLAALDPTLREDLLERSRQVEYTGSSRNIFQTYTPPPPPPPPAPPSPPPTPAPDTDPAPRPGPPPTPPPPDISLKFYGVASPPGAGEKKAFLSDGEEIIIAKEGEVVASFYKVIRIGVNSIELEDNRSQQKRSLPLVEE